MSMPARSDAHSKMTMPVRAGKEESVDRVIGEDKDKDQREVKEVSMYVLQDEREFTLTAVFISRLANGASRRVRPERLVIRPAIVITREPKPARRPKY